MDSDYCDCAKSSLHTRQCERTLATPANHNVAQLFEPHAKRSIELFPLYTELHDGGRLQHWLHSTERKTQLRLNEILKGGKTPELQYTNEVKLLVFYCSIQTTGCGKSLHQSIFPHRPEREKNLRQSLDSKLATLLYLCIRHTDTHTHAATKHFPRLVPFAYSPCHVLLFYYNSCCFKAGLSPEVQPAAASVNAGRREKGEVR